MSTAIFVDDNASLVSRRVFVRQGNSLRSAFIYKVAAERHEIGLVFDGSFLLRNVVVGEEDVAILAMEARRPWLSINEGDIIKFFFDCVSVEAMVMCKVNNQGSLGAFLFRFSDSTVSDTPVSPSSCTVSTPRPCLSIMMTTRTDKCLESLYLGLHQWNHFSFPNYLRQPTCQRQQGILPKPAGA